MVGVVIDQRLYRARLLLTGGYFRPQEAPAMRTVLSERMAREVADWRHSGLIDDTVAVALAARYAGREAILRTSSIRS